MTIIHWECKTITFNASCGSQCLQECFSKRYAGIFDGVMLSNFQISFHFDYQIATGVARYLVEHVVEKPKSCINFRLSTTIQVQFDKNIGFIRFSFNTRAPFSCKKKFSYPIPIGSLKRAERCQIH